MHLKPSLKKLTACVLIVTSLNLTASAAVMPAVQKFRLQSSETTDALNEVNLVVNNNTGADVSKPVSLSVLTKTQPTPEEKKKKKKKALIWIIAGAVVVVAVILFSGGKKSTKPTGPAY